MPCWTTSALPISSSFGAGFRLRAGAGAARVADGDRAGVVVGHRPEHVDELVFILRLHVDDVRDVAQIADVEEAVVRWAVVAAQAGAIHAERDVQILQRDVVDDHVVGALHEGRVDRQERLQPLGREAAGEERGVLLGDADVEVACRDVAPGKMPSPVPLGMAPVMATILLLVSANFAERLAEELGVGRRRRGRGLAGFGLEFAEAVKLVRLGDAPARSPCPFS